MTATNDPITMFLKSAYIAPDARCLVTDVLAGVRRLAPAATRHRYTRTLVLERLKDHGFTIGKCGNRFYVAGLDLSPRQWVVQSDGRMVLV